MLEKVSACPICNHTDFKEHIICTDHMVTKEKFTIVKCDHCNFLFTNPKPDKNHISSYYKSDQYISHTDKSNNLVNSIYKIARHFTIKQKVKLVTSLASHKTILDFGCGTGDLLHAFKKANWKAFGFEPDKQASVIAKKKSGLEIFNQLDQLDTLSDISMISLWHVLEHVTDLNRTIQKLRSILSVGGKILIAVPNNESFDAEYYQQFWAAYDVPRHLYHFTQQSMEKLMKKHALKIINIHPMKLDSFYVSLLSEKYQSGSSNMIKSFLNGWKSNIYAKKHNNNYSSLIYIVSK